jgi:hypothetical protein
VRHKRILRDLGEYLGAEENSAEHHVARRTRKQAVASPEVRIAQPGAPAPTGEPAAPDVDVPVPDPAQTPAAPVDPARRAVADAYRQRVQAGD